MKAVVVALMCVGLAVLAEAGKNCHENPCKDDICRAYPEAECRVDYCRGGTAWYDGDKVVDCDECPFDDAVTTCKDKCATSSCPNYPDAQSTKRCRMYNCGQCTAEYFDPGSNYPLDCWA
ncbi:uncharacterized protein LOC100891896 [Strongylocentrotus purpuratus]|uniref:Uncharacterized protein n=1 Tax=Strongylocentrotus purpuratus TaxID=7668 RepID=A0A7M7GJE7_STRPU|nr:uncharacterized protein LOC100891896 [Strongylocentrotus purpuratus]|eukprot:XP_003730483.1 PREDICTED: uncharacterized protein LOC100891896 [Strongylocentrotus purpuratus]